MYIEHLSLTNFRNYSRLAIDFPQGIVLLQGENAQGKTNLLEAIHYLSRMRSPRTSSERELVNWLTLEDDLPFTRLLARIHRGDETHQIELAMLQKIPESALRDSTAWRKSVRVNGVNTRSSDAVGVVSSVLFLPQDIDVIDSAPSLRRNYIDETISQVDSQYRRELQRYGRVLSQRNHLLRSMRDRSYNETELHFWNERLVRHGAYVTARREQVILELEALAQHIHSRLTGNQERLQLQYRSSVLSGATGGSGQMQLLPEEHSLAFRLRDRVSEVSDRFLERLGQARQRELARGMSIVGPHRDDLGFWTNRVDMNVYGSRGQQRTIALSLKLAEVEWLTQQRGDGPVLLLDDVLSELDARRRSFLFAAIEGAPQVVITTNNLEPYDASFLARAAIWRVQAGRLERFTSL